MSTTRKLLDAAGYKQSPDERVWSREGYGGIAYSDGDGPEEALLATLRGATDLSVFSPELANACVDWPSRYHLSTERANLLRPFAQVLKPGVHVLEIGAGCGAVTRYIGETGAEVVALEGSRRRALIGRERTRDLDNVEIVAERFQDFTVAQPFDVVTLIGVLEYASVFSDAQDPALHMLQAVQHLLAPSGRLIVAIENQLGLKYLAGVPEDHLGEPMVGLEGRYLDTGARTYGRQELERILARAGFAHQRFFAPLPDYKMPATILTERGASDAFEDFDAGALASQAVRRDPQLTPTTFNLQRSWPIVATNGLAMHLANSFLIEAASNAPGLPEDGVLAYHYSTQRIARYARESVFVQKPGAGVRVTSRRLAADTEAEPTSMVRLNVNSETPYHRGTLLAETTRALLSRPGWTTEALVTHTRDYLSALDQILRHEGHNLTLSHPNVVLPDDFIDATPSNLIRLEDGQVTYFDREWIVVQPTLGWLVWRSLLFLYGGTVLAPMALHSDGQELSLRTLLATVLSKIFGTTIVDEPWLRRELAFQHEVTGRDQEAAIAGMLDAFVPHTGVVDSTQVMPANEPYQKLMDGIASLRHILNLSSQHGSHIYTSITALHSTASEGFRMFEPLLHRSIELAEAAREGQVALQDRLVGNDDALAQLRSMTGDGFRTLEPLLHRLTGLAEVATERQVALHDRLVGNDDALAQLRSTTGEGFRTLEPLLQRLIGLAEVAAQGQVAMHDRMVGNDDALAQLRSTTGEGFRTLEPVLHRLIGLAEAAAEGQVAMHDRMVGNHDVLTQFIQHWKAEQSDVLGKLGEAVIATDHKEALQRIETRLDTISRIQAEQVEAQALSAIRRRRWWKFR